MTRTASAGQSILWAVIDALSTTADVPEALSRVLSLVAETLGLKTGWVWLTDADSGEFYNAAVQNLPPYLKDPVRMTGSTCWCIDAFRLRKLTPANIDVMQCSRLTSAAGSEQVAATEGLRYHASIPLYFQDKPLGIMNVAASSWRKLTPDELRILSAVAYQVGLSVERARLAEEKASLARSEERARIAREIHDTLAQGLTAIILHLEGAAPHLESKPALARERMQKALAVAQTSLEEARRSVLDLRAAPLDGKPLSEALRALARTFASETGIRITLHIEDITDLPHRAEAELFRIAQEALNNVRRHAQATAVEVCLESRPTPTTIAENEGTPDWITLAVTDDGIGFRRASVRAGAHGLVGMRERAKLLGGSLRLAANPGKGTRVLVNVPRPESHD